MNDKVKQKLDELIQDMKDNGFEKEIPLREVDNSIMRICGLSHMTMHSYHHALLGCGYMKERIPKRVWVILK